MGHRDKVVKLGRTKSHRDATLSNMAMSLFIHRIIKTTDSKAKALKPIVDKIITMAKKDTLHSKRLVALKVKQKDVFKLLFAEIVPQFADRTSGFTRIVKLGVRKGDGAPMSVVELLVEKKAEPTDKKGKKIAAKKADKKADKKAEKAAK